MELERGNIVSIKGEIVEVEFYRNPPFIGEILTLEKDPNFFLEVYKSSKENSFLCFSLSDPSKLTQRRKSNKDKKIF